MPLYAFQGMSPVLAKDVFVAPNATIIGDVTIGEGSSVWFGTVARGDVFSIRIGARTNVQDNSVVHVTGGKAKTTIGDEVTIGHAAVIHGCTIGSRCLVGMGSIVLDDAIVEDGCFIAAGTLLPPRMRVPTGSFVVGRPGKVLRKLRPEELAQIRESAELYRGYADSYRTRLTAL